LTATVRKRPGYCSHRTVACTSTHGGRASVSAAPRIGRATT
jgi:hypothetical protein